jgi:mannobiose 2-epimerase
MWSRSLRRAADAARFGDGGALDDQSAAAFARELEQALRQILEAWLPRCVAAGRGGFLCNFDARWRPSRRQPRMLEFQARMTRLTARVAAHPGFGAYAEFASHGFAYLRDVLWDREHGGWFRMLDPDGTPREGANKHGHGTSYAISACIAHHELTGDPESLALARSGFAWLDAAGHDAEHGGYFGPYRRDGSRIAASAPRPARRGARDCIGTPWGLKDANTNGDVLDALAELFRAAPDPLVKERLAETFHVVRDHVIVAPGFAHYYFQPDWTPVPDFARFGFGLHASNILANAASALHLDADPSTQSVIRSLVDTSLRHGWDAANGGFFCGGASDGAAARGIEAALLGEKIWWIQAEGLRALLRTALGQPDGERLYLRRLGELWRYVQRCVVDRARGGWRIVGLDSKPRRRRAPKANPWKDPSHEVLSLLECVTRLRSRSSVRPPA